MTNGSIVGKVACETRFPCDSGLREEKVLLRPVSYGLSC